MKYLYHAAVRIVYSLSKIRCHIDTKTTAVIFILSRLEYGSLLCTSSSKKLVDKLQRLAYRSLRICFCQDKKLNIYEAHIKARLLPLKLRNKIHILNLMFTANLNMKARYSDKTDLTWLRVLSPEQNGINNV